ncbi:SRPBCC domain-containing protein [uncultured Acinetobacter sp.]|uniref:SRPBCC domain-containing protein n=1 Tax=uncultured Acinetobacter sp. TaxID=165433 RepID=UPI002616C6A1|nr:SRPBCC domain-containing protein [uncultured Acinetobacter sp.]
MSYTVKMYRVFSAPPERVYRAFVDPGAMAKWLAPHGFIAAVEYAEVRPGGRYRITFTNFSTGTQHYFYGMYHEVIPNQLLRYSDQFSTPESEGEIEVTVIFEKVSVGTGLHIIQVGYPDLVPPAVSHLCWQESLQLLSWLVNPHISDI